METKDVLKDTAIAIDISMVLALMAFALAAGKDQIEAGFIAIDQRLKDQGFEQIDIDRWVPTLKKAALEYRAGSGKEG